MAGAHPGTELQLGCAGGETRDQAGGEPARVADILKPRDDQDQRGRPPRRQDPGRASLCRQPLDLGQQS